MRNRGILHFGLWRLGEIAFVECEEFGPGAFGSGFVVDLAAAHRPTVIAAVVNLDRCGDMRCAKGGFESVLGGGIALVVVVGAAATFHGGGLVTDKPDSPHMLIPKMKAEVLCAVPTTTTSANPQPRRHS